MKLYIKQRVFTWGDRFNVMDEGGDIRYTVEGQVFSLGKKLRIYDCHDREVAYIEQELFTFLPCYHVYVGGAEVARIHKEFSFFTPRYTIEGPDWDVEGQFLLHDYQITEKGREIVSIEKEWMTWGDSYVLDIARPDDEVLALATVIMIDCVIDSQNNN